MNIVTYIIIGILGTVVWSFWSVLTTRLEKDISRKTIQSILIGRSRCDNDQKALKRQQLIPIRSYIAHKGRCWHCWQKIAPWYLRLEIASAVVFMATYYILTHYTTANLGSIIAWMMLNELLLLLALYDARTQLLHMSLRYVSLIPVTVIIFHNNAWKESLLYTLIYITITTAIYRAAKRYAHKKHQQKEGLGQGDIYIMAIFGAVVPVVLSYHHIASQGVTTMINSYLRIIIIASCISLGHRWLQQLSKSKKTADKDIAFIPGLVLWFWIVAITANYRQNWITH